MDSGGKGTGKENWMKGGKEKEGDGTI